MAGDPKYITRLRKIDIKNKKADELVSILNKMLEVSKEYCDTETNLDQFVEAMSCQNSTYNLVPVEGALVMCTNAIDQDKPVKVVKDDYVQVTLSGLAELNCTDVTVAMPFSGCKEAADKICRVQEEVANRRKWQGLDQSKNEGEGKEGLLSEDSYMICEEGCGIIYFVDSGQKTKNLVDSLDTFMDNIQEQFGFDERTVSIMAEVYVRIQEVYWDKSQEERDWYFTRAISQMGGYNSKSVDLKITKVETYAWQKGAGKAYKYNTNDEGSLIFEERYFCQELGLDLDDYRYFRHMIRLQHYITSNENNIYAYSTVANMLTSEEGKKELQDWMSTMTKGTGKVYYKENNGHKIYYYEEYLSDYKEIYDKMNEKGDFSHMLYTISANLTDESWENGVDDHWINIGALEMSWYNAEERGDITGWLGDAVYRGDEGVSFQNDDYIADLDADNIVHRMENGNGFLEEVNRYYGEMGEVSWGAEDSQRFRTKEFLRNNPYDEVENKIFIRISPHISLTLESLQKKPEYEETCIFLEKLTKYSE